MSSHATRLPRRPIRLKARTVRECLTRVELIDAGRIEEDRIVINRVLLWVRLCARSPHPRR